MAHLLEHMVFKGTPTHPDVPKALRDHGAEFNGTPGSTAPTTSRPCPPPTTTSSSRIKLEADRLVNSSIKREDLATELTVVRNEFESGENSPAAVLIAADDGRRLRVAQLRQDRPSATAPTSSACRSTTSQAFYKKYYQPDNAVLVVAGKFDEEKALES